MQDNHQKIQLEIERKYIIANPLSVFNEIGCEISKADILQTYLVSHDGLTKRVRKSIQNGIVSYIYNEKKPLDGFTRFEKEFFITKDEYLKLLSEADSSLSVITKTRYTLPYQGFIYEIDIYPFSASKAILEVELKDKRIIPPWPPFLTLIKEVTGDKAYSNLGLAKAVPHELTL